MKHISVNPFTITKAVDLSDSDILQLWVNLPEDETNNLVSFIKPTSLMPMFIVGGKGSGKTHLIRYVSFPVRQIHHNDNLIDGISSDGFIALYLRCGGMNSSRFFGKSISDAIWTQIFAYYIELWTAKNTLDAIFLISNTVNCRDKEEKFCNRFISLFDKGIESNITSINEASKFLTSLLKELDYSVNNCIYGDTKFPDILCTRGNLIYEIPSIFNAIYFEQKVIFQYIFDEFENFNEQQQVYINTLLRERRGDCSFKIGSRLFGIRTHKTLCADEENKEGSEFESVNLDKYYRNNESYDKFAVKLVNTRLTSEGFNLAIASTNSSLLQFNEYIQTSLEENLLQKVAEKNFFDRGFIKKFLKNIFNQQFNIDALRVKNLLSETTSPLLQKACIHYVYTSISQAINLELDKLSTDIEISERNATPQGILKEILQHFKSDFLAQLCREFGITVPYGGLSNIINLSMGNPRHLLILFKFIYDWALYKDEIQGSSIIISIESQESGIRNASDWFYNDAKLIGADGEHVQASIVRLCDLFRAYRYADKPSECAVSLFSVDITQVSARTKEVIETAEKWSLIIDSGTHNKKNSGSKIHKYQINILLSPRWEIATAKRGTIQLSAQEANAIFDEKNTADFEKLKRIRLKRMTFPFRIDCRNRQKSLLEFGDEYI